MPANDEYTLSEIELELGDEIARMAARSSLDRDWIVYILAHELFEFAEANGDYGVQTLRSVITEHRRNRANHLAAIRIYNANRARRPRT